MLLAVAVLIAGCGGPALAPSPCPASVPAATPPPGEYLDSQAVIDYDALVPPGDPRRNVDMAYARQVIADPMLLEQIYYDATHGNQRAAWLVCELEATALSGGRRVARHMGSVRCRALGTCRARWDELPISRDTASGQRLLSVLATGFREEARRQALEDELIANALMVLVGARIAARASLSSAPATRGTLRPMARSLGAAGDDLLLEKAVNSNLPHAIARGVERGVFASAEEAAAALRALTEQITASRTFPAGTLVDTVRTGRFLVPVGNNGLAVYQLASNGTAKLKTILIAR